MKITAAIITFNEGENIQAACESVAWADEILVVDSESTDDTREIATRCGARVILNACCAVRATRVWPTVIALRVALSTWDAGFAAGAGIPIASSAFSNARAGIGASV